MRVLRFVWMVAWVLIVAWCFSFVVVIKNINKAEHELLVQKELKGINSFKIRVDYTPPKTFVIDEGRKPTGSNILLINTDLHKFGDLYCSDLKTVGIKELTTCRDDNSCYRNLDIHYLCFRMPSVLK